MKRVVYISSEAFFDVDFPILRGLKSKYDVTWIPVLRENGWYTREEIDAFSQESGVKCLPILQTHKYKDPRIVSFYLKLLRLIRAQNADIIYFEYFGVPIFHLLTSFYLDINKVVVAIHDVEQHYKIEYGKIKGVYFEYILKKYNHFQVFSDSQLDIFKERYPKKNVFSAKLYLKDFGSPNVQRDIKKKVNFLFFGIIRANKGLDILIQAANRLAVKRSDFKVTIAGDCKDWKFYDELIEKREYFELTIRKIKNSEIPNLFTSAHYLVLPYIDVTQSGVLLTAYNYNLPAVASDLPGFHEYIIDKNNGFLFTPSDVDSLEEKLEYILDKHDSFYPEITVNLKKYLHDNINLDEIIGRYVKFFNSIM